jgi:sec-independent protein translocase protein TatA
MGLEATMPFNIGPFELLLVLVIVLLILGPGKLPQVGSSLAKTLREIRNSASEDESAADVSAPDSRAGGGTPAAGHSRDV